MQPWLAGLIGGIIWVSQWRSLPERPALCCAGLVTIAAVALLCGRYRAGRVCAGIALGCVLGVVHGVNTLQHRLPVECVRQPLTLWGTVASLPRVSTLREGVIRQRFEFDLRAVQAVHCVGPRRVLLSYYGEQPVVPGQRWRFEARLKRPWGLANPGAFNLQAWYAQTGIDAVGNASAGRVEYQPPAHARAGLRDRTRLAISERIARLPLAPAVTAILRAVTVADKSGIDNRLWSLLQHYGINHLLVISGLHVSLVAGAGYLAGRTALRLFLLAGWRASWLPGALALLCAGCYAALAGFSLATLRALCMLACFVLAALAGRRSGSANNLLLAAAVVLVLNPLAALGSGFWLSFLAVAALLWLSHWQRGTSLARRLLFTHLFMSLVMLPLGAWWFGGASLVAALANLVMIPLVGLVVVPLALLGVTCSLLGWSSAAAALWHLAGWPLQHLLPGAAELAHRYSPWLYHSIAASLPAVLLALLGVTLLALPGRRALAAAAPLLLLPLLLPLQAGVVREADRVTRITVLDVGQGTAVVLRAGSRALLYDTGGGDPEGVTMAHWVIVPYLRAQGVRSLDTLVVSHPDRDHSAGTATVRRAMAVHRFLRGGAEGRVAGGHPCRAGQSWRWPGGQTFRVLSPAGEAGLSSNNGSCVLQVDIDGYRLLLPGDIEAQRERLLVRRWGAALRSDWLLLAHHGSATSTTQTLLKTVRPDTVVISHGYANRFGHPHPDVLQTLRRNGLAPLATAELGALEFEVVAGRLVAVEAQRHRQRRYWM
ncbi:MAG: DNA internalization-related competence protein ComEC/Rec2 [Halioglobus sp.]|nr:DNA internalization-related competence protein ComEC/Rec2 [Halioglobus sp.]